MSHNNNQDCSLDIAQVFEHYVTDQKGLTNDSAAKRLAKDGPNEIQSETNIAAWSIFLRQFKSPLVLILLFASAISYYFGETRQVLMIGLMVGISSSLAFYQEYRSERALRLLRKKLTRYATVIRDGKTTAIDARELVKGDVVILDIGNVAPADLRVIAIEDLEMDESMLTGESVPVSKSVAAIGGTKLTPQEQVNMVFMGTNVIQGAGRGIVVAIGKDTEMGRTAALLAERTEETDFQKGVRDFSRFLLQITVGLIFFVAMGMGFIRGNWIESLLFALALAVGLSPELFPMIVAINLSRGATHMAKKHVLVKRLIAIEDLGNADVFCTDKTGTLTVGKIRVRGAIGPHGTETKSPIVYGAKCLSMGPSGRADNPIDQAILESAAHEDVPGALKDIRLVDIISFDYSRRRMSCVIENRGRGCSLIVKGAVRETLAICTTMLDEKKGASLPMTQSDRERLLALSDKYQDDGNRLLAVARRAIETKDAYTPEDEQGLELVGFILMSDAPKQTAKAALVSLRDLGVRITILTGDTERVTRHVAKQLDFPVVGLLTGKDVEALDDKGLEEAAERTNVFTGITPSQKLRIIHALKKHGHTVGFMGDGVNDAPSLRAADVGISFDDAIDVAKESASVILLKKNLSVLADGIREGRRTFANTQTYINTTISSNFGNMLSLAGASIFLPFLPMLPAQILLLNILSDLPMLGISSDRVSDKDLARPHKWDIKRISRFMWFFGPISSIADYATFGLLFVIVQANAELFRSGWFIESLITEVVVIFLLRSRITALSNLPSKILTVTCFFAIGVALFINQTTVGQSFELTPLPIVIIAYILLIVTAYAVMVEIGKRIFYRYIEKPEILASVN